MSDTPAETDELQASNSEPRESALDSDRYAHLPLDNGELVIYDREAPETWLQSDVTVDIGV